MYLRAILGTLTKFINVYSTNVKQPTRRSHRTSHILLAGGRRCLRLVGKFQLNSVLFISSRVSIWDVRIFVWNGREMIGRFNRRIDEMRCGEVPACASTKFRTSKRWECPSLPLAPSPTRCLSFAIKCYSPSLPRAALPTPPESPNLRRKSQAAPTWHVSIGNVMLAAE